MKNPKALMNTQAQAQPPAPTPLPLPLSPAELKQFLERIHRQIQANREAIAEDEPNWTDPRRELWQQLLDCEYYALQSIEAMDELAEGGYVCNRCRGSGEIVAPPVYPRFHRATGVCPDCHGEGKVALRT